MKTLLQLEQTFFDLAASCRRNTLVISDRGAMDPSSCKFREQSCLNSYSSLKPPHLNHLFIPGSFVGKRNASSSIFPSVANQLKLYESSQNNDLRSHQGIKLGTPCTESHTLSISANPCSSAAGIIGQSHIILKPFA